MLKGISAVIGPELLKVLCEMGHGDYIVFSDAHFPSMQLGPKVIRMDGVSIVDILKGVMPLWEIDSYVDDPFCMMQPVPGDSLDMNYVRRCIEVVGREPVYIERFAFYEKARRACAIVHSGELCKYGNIILQKGVIPVQK